MLTASLFFFTKFMERMPMTSFDSWEDRIRPLEDYLMHSGKKGMKHGQRRYQNEDGTWTELGLAERRKREGFGERRAAKKAAKAERKQARKAIRAEARAALAEKRRKRNIKNLTDEELQQRISRLKMEREYKDLNKSPIIETGMKLVNKYLDYKADKDAKAERRYNMETNRINAQANLRRAKAEKQRAIADEARAKADRKRAKSDIIDNLTFGQGRKNAKKNLIEAKERAKENTLSGIILSNFKKKKDASTEAKLYKDNEYYRAGVNDRRANERQKIENDALKSKAQIEIGRGQQEMGKGMQEKANAERYRSSDEKKKKKDKK